jgi:hypothetical protein
MISKRKLLYFLLFLNSILAFANTSVSFLSDSWVLVKPIRILFINQTIILSENNLFQFLNIPSYKHNNQDCIPLNGMIKFGLFKGVWFLNYGYGCRIRSGIFKITLIKII